VEHPYKPNGVITIVDNLRLRAEVNQLRTEICQMRQQRDEARQRLCKVVGDNRDMWGEDVAKEYGWDCFEEKNHNA